MTFLKSLYLLVLLACVSSTSCQSSSTAHSRMTAIQTDRFRLYATPGCADGYPAEIDEARFNGKQVL